MRLREVEGMCPGGCGIVMTQSPANGLVYNESHNRGIMIKYLQEMKH